MFTFNLRRINGITPIMSMLERCEIHYLSSNIIIIIKIIMKKHCSIYRWLDTVDSHLFQIYFS